MSYTLTSGVLPVDRQFIRRDDGAEIPPAPRNADFAQYLAWLAAGNTPTAPPAEPAPTVLLTFLQFMALFTPAEQAAIVSSTDTQTKLFLLMATGAGALDLSNAEVIAGIGYLAATASSTPPGPGLIAAARAAQILANQPPAS